MEPKYRGHNTFDTMPIGDALKCALRREFAVSEEESLGKDFCSSSPTHCVKPAQALTVAAIVKSPHSFDPVVAIAPGNHHCEELAQIPVHRW